jgi:hypothetical protein
MRTEHALLLDACRLGVALQHDEPPQRVSELARHFLPDRQSLEVAEPDAAIGGRFGQEDAPAIVRQLDVIEVRPPRRIDTDGRAQIHLVLVLEPLGAHVPPPVEVRRLPVLERAQQPLVAREVHVVRDTFVELHESLR